MWFVQMFELSKQLMFFSCAICVKLANFVKKCFQKGLVIFLAMSVMASSPDVMSVLMLYPISLRLVSRRLSHVVCLQCRLLKILLAQLIVNAERLAETLGKFRPPFLYDALISVFLS